VNVVGILLCSILVVSVSRCEDVVYMCWSSCVKQFDWCACIVWNSLIGVPVFCETVWLVCLYCVKQFDWCPHIVWNSLTGVPVLCETVSLVCLYCVEQFDWCAYVLSYSFLQITFCRSYLKPYCMGRKTMFFQWAFKFTYYTRNNRSPLQEKKIMTIKLKKDRMITLFSSYL
jgi:hypothetical protein